MSASAGGAMFERFARDARRVLERAHERARMLGAERVEPEHLLLALACGATSSPAARALAEASVAGEEAITEALEQELVAALEVVGVPPAVVASVPALPRGDSPRISLATRDALEASLREAVALGSRRIGSEHLLLGVLRRPTGTVRRVLTRLDVEPERLATLVRVEIAAQRRCA